MARELARVVVINTRIMVGTVGLEVIVGQIDPTGQVWYVDLTIVFL